MKSRSADEVHALWPKGKNQYKFTVAVTTTAASRAQAAAELQKLFNTEGSVAGRFSVISILDEMAKETTFKVNFFRDVPDDRPVVEDELLKGKDFAKTLSKQFQAEMKEGMQITGVSLKLKILDGPTFSILRL